MAARRTTAARRTFNGRTYANAARRADKRRRRMAKYGHRGNGRKSWLAAWPHGAAN